MKFNYQKKNEYFDSLINNKDLMWMGQNTNHIPSHKAVKESLIKSIHDEEYHVYAPPLGLEELRELVLNHLNLKNNDCFITDGAVSALSHVCNSLIDIGDEFLTTDPTWIWPTLFSRHSGGVITQIPIYDHQSNFKITASAIEKNISPKTKILYLVDPNNPLGTTIDKAEIEAIAEIAKSNDIYVLHDCTYRDFARNHTFFNHYYPEGTVTIWSFSKWLGIAGLRVGALLAPPQLVEKFSKNPPNILGSNIISQRGAIAGLKYFTEWFPEVNLIQRNNQQIIYESVKNIDELSMPIYPSESNFVIVEINSGSFSPESLTRSFLEKNIMIRQGKYHSEKFGHKFVKISLSVPTEWAKSFSDYLPDRVNAAKNFNDDTSLF
jgi:aspartate/methionine/tyrosine aminotransferase